jgi:serine/threonine protein kinase
MKVSRASRVVLVRADTDLNISKPYAVKVLRMPSNRVGLDLANQEIAIHEKLSHCNILQFIEAITPVKEIHLVFELCGEGTILDFLYNSESDK